MNTLPLVLAAGLFWAGPVIVVDGVPDDWRGVKPAFDAQPHLRMRTRAPGHPGDGARHDRVQRPDARDMSLGADGLVRRVQAEQDDRHAELQDDLRCMRIDVEVELRRGRR